jgi:hypothetical protein
MSQFKTATLRAVPQPGRTSEALALGTPTPADLANARPGEAQIGYVTSGRDADRAVETSRGGKDLLNLVACGAGETQQVYVTLALPLVEDLVREAGDNRPTTRTAASLAGHAFADYVYHLGQLRQTEDVVLKGPAQKHREQLQRRVDMSFKQALAALELLRRPGEPKIHVNLGAVGNLNVGGPQHVAVKVRGVRRRKQTGSTR